MWGLGLKRKKKNVTKKSGDDFLGNGVVLGEATEACDIKVVLSPVRVLRVWVVLVNTYFCVGD